MLQDGVQTGSCDKCIQAVAPAADLNTLTVALLQYRKVPGMCPNCGTTQQMAIETGLLACPLCYEMLDEDALNHFGLSRGSWKDNKTWSLQLTISKPLAL